jgi:class 3 adenylate cyclase
VQLAHRLCSEAEADGVMVSGLVRELSDEDKGRFVALGERRLKGFTERTPVFRFEWRGKCDAELFDGAIVAPERAVRKAKY